MALLQVENLNIAFQSGRKKFVPVVSGISFSVERGEILALVGESGCGKSISCMALTGLLPKPQARVQADSIFFDGKSGAFELASMPPRQLRKMRGGRIGYIFQEPSVSLNPVFRAGEQVAEVLALHRPDVADRRAEVIELFRQVGIPAPESRINAFPHELSGGMQQRVMIAMALAGNPELLIADEPTTALDVTIQAQILELIDSLRRERNMAVILVTHNLGIVAELADRVAVMYAGTMAEYGNASGILTSPRHPYTRALLKAVPHLGGEGGELATIPGHVPPPEEFSAGCRFCDRCSLAAALPETHRKRCCTLRPESSGTPDHQVFCHEEADL